MAHLDTIKQDMKTALKAGEKARVSTLRMLMAALQKAEIDAGHDLDDEEEMTVLTREGKRRRESMEAFAKAGRDDLVAKETQELAVIETYLPAQLSPAEAREILGSVIAEVGATSKRDLGKVMGKAMAALKGRFPGKEIRVLVEQLLSD